MGGERRSDVQGLRALAILFVILYHGNFGLRGGFVGVDVFFVISGFVITTTLQRELETAGSLDVRGFYVRRVKRILPALAVVVSVVAITSPLLAPIAAIRISSLTALFASVFAANWYLASLPDGYFSVSAALDPLLHTWSLAVEEQFYLVYPVLLFAAWRLGRRLGGARLVALGVLLICTVASFDIAAFWNAENATRVFYASPGRAWEFGAGALTALLVKVWERLPQLLCSALGAASIALLVASTFGTSNEHSLTVRVLVPVMATCGLIVAGTRTNVVSALLSRRPMTAVGDVSYSLYLWHWPLIVFAHALAPSSAWAPRLAAVLAYLPAALSYRLIENPIRRLQLSRRGALALTFACVGASATAALATLPISFVTPAVYAPQFHEDVDRGCDDAAPLGSATRSRCNFSVRDSRGVIVLIGDSNAGQFTEPVLASARHLKFDARVVTFSSCPFVPLRFSIGGEQGECEHHNSVSLRRLVHLRPSLVIVAGRSDAWLNDSTNSIGYGPVPLTSKPALKERLYERALHAELASLTRHDIPVVLVHPVPLLNADEPACASILLLLGGCSGVTSRQSVERELHRAVRAEDRSASGLEGVTLLDFEDRLCRKRTCSARQHGVPMYRNVNHLSVVGARTLTKRFTATIRDHAVVDPRYGTKARR